MNVTDTDQAASFATRLREATRVQHTTAETTGFVEALMSGRLSVAAYTDLARQHHVIYSALEAAGARLSGADAALVFSELLRIPSLTADLAQLAGPRWVDLPVHEATRRYADRIAEVGGSTHGYAAHAYTRYLGDLSGGQAIGRILSTRYGLPDQALTFYKFSAIEKVKPFKDQYRSLLDNAPWSEEQRDQLVAEAQLAFDLNTALFAELGARHLAAAGV